MLINLSIDSIDYFAHYTIAAFIFYYSITIMIFKVVKKIIIYFLVCSHKTTDLQTANL